MMPDMEERAGDEGNGYFLATTAAEVREKGIVVVRGPDRNVALIECAGGRIVAIDNRCPHMGFPLDRGTVQDGILTCHWHHARFDLARSRRVPPLPKASLGSCPKGRGVRGARLLGARPVHR